MAPMLPMARRRSFSSPPPERFKLLSPEAQPAQFVIDLVDGVAMQAKGPELCAWAHADDDNVPWRTLKLDGMGKNVVKEGVFKVPAGRPVQLFDAQIERAEGQHLGALLRRWSPNSLVVIRLSPHGLLARWNAGQPKRQVHVGDLINKVVADDRLVSHKDMPKVLEGTSRAKLLLSLGRKGGDGEEYFDILVQKHARFQRLGLDLLIEEEELIVTQVVKDGPVCKWNSCSGGGPVVAAGDSIVAVNDLAGTPAEMLDALESPKMGFTLTVKKPRQTEWVKGDAPSWSLDLALAPKTKVLIEEREQELLATNATYVERPEGFDVNGRETYWSQDGKYYVFFNSFREWSVGKVEHFNINRGSPDGGRRFALAVDCRRERDIWEAGPSQGWLQWDMLLGQWVCSCEEAGVAETGLTCPDEMQKNIRVILPGGREQTVRVPSLANLRAVAAEVEKRLKVAEGKELRFRQAGRELEIGSRVLRVSQAVPLEAGIFTAHDELGGGTPRSLRSPQSYRSQRSLHSPCGLGSPPCGLGSPRRFGAAAGLNTSTVSHGYPSALDASFNSQSSVSSPTSACSGSPRRRGRPRLAAGGTRRVPEQWLKIPCDALFVDGTHLGR